MSTPTIKQPLALKAKPAKEVIPGKSKILTFGPSGVGKTWFTLAFPCPYYFDTEAGADLPHYQERLKAVGGAYLGPSDGTLDFEFLFHQMLSLSTIKHAYRTFVIDSITKLFAHRIAEEQERLGVDDVFGASKKPAIACLRRVVMLAARLDMNIVFVAREATEWGKNPKTGQREEIGKMEDVWDQLRYELNLTLHIQRRGGSRVAVVKKSRLTGFPENEVFPLDYGEFAKRYGKDVIEAESTPIILATAEQQAELSRLLSGVKLKDGEFEKILTAANAENVGELSEEQAASTIKWLKDKISK